MPSKAFSSQDASVEDSDLRQSMVPAQVVWQIAVSVLETQQLVLFAQELELQLCPEFVQLQHAQLANTGVLVVVLAPLAMPTAPSVTQVLLPVPSAQQI